MSTQTVVESSPRSRAKIPATWKVRADWFWGLGSRLEKTRAEIDFARQQDVNVLIIGETGTGKELAARMIHEGRRRRMGSTDSEAPFIALNSGAIPESLAESILFGHERGAFTSARERQYGKFELARKGTLFLDEIQSLALETQVKLLRVLQSRELERLGGHVACPIHCQVIAATNVPLELLVERQTFRKDLYYRLNVCPIYLPALRHRKEDLPILIRGLLEKLKDEHQIEASEVSPAAYEALFNHAWPGNLRELEHALFFASLRAQKTIELLHLPGSVTGSLSHYLASGLWDL